VWAVVVVLVLAVAAVGGKAYLDRQWFVGVSDGLVALYKGAPLELFGIDLFSLVEETRLSSARASALQPWSDLESGITAGSEREARQIIAQIERDLSSPAPSPGPSPATPSPSP
jgi:protein phosphatase